MIEELRIADLGVIEQAEVSLAPGLTAITGETGAGKTMVLTGLSLILGGRADSGAVRVGAERAQAEGRFLVDPHSSVADRARDAGAELDEDGGLVAARTVAAAGRSRAYLGGRGVPVTVLTELADALVTVHGQADQARLRSPRHQRGALDAFAGADHAGAVARYRELWAQRQATGAELAALEATAVERAREAELLRLGLAEVERVDPQPDEDLELAAEAERLGHLEDLRAAAALAHGALDEVGDEPGGASAIALVESARRALDQVAVHDEQLRRLAERVAEVGYLAADVAADIAGYADSLEADPGRLDLVQSRRAELSALARAHGGTVADVLAWASDAGPRLVELDGGDDRRAELLAALSRLDAALSEAARRLTEDRTAAAEQLSAAVTAELAGLAMADASFTVLLHPLDELGPWGGEDVEMLLAGHPGAPARPLGQGASGGELSRVMLAIEVALATAEDLDRPATFVFDEVDAGVGGRAAVEVGRRLAELAQHAQVVVVTHLAQVAAYADHHVVVTKPTGEVVTASDVHAVTGQDRVAELARMLSGTASSTALEHAAELLQRSVVGR
ncbi:DNA repair protein RecN [Isoptericola sp. b441]|uniref:DNA repair protein RecN n=1 Tax=Actinotalea lenta TaxID=3064654 RepID=A0ABT9D9A2_9CELL|nr:MULTISPECIES: DNA repair protein RecN [unclassified Isoptericola]MDO8107482.1 DNA repair protein RecN [Isoptericola sp. b441]MDO8120858.1 DNA repair protein RecN [Isoptericola sp. b490]